MDTYEYLKSNFKLYKQEKYNNVNLSADTRRILCDIGLPYQPLEFIQFNIEEIDNIKLDENYIVIGNDFGTNICINDKDEVVSVDIKNEYPIRYINKNLKSFLNCIIIFSMHENEINNADEEEIKMIIKKVRKEFDETDVYALNNEENWWSVILEQIEE